MDTNSSYPARQCLCNVTLLLLPLRESIFPHKLYLDYLCDWLEKQNVAEVMFCDFEVGTL